MQRKLYQAVGLTALASVLVSTSAWGAMLAQDFVAKASVANKFEIESSKLALKKSESAHIRSFAQRMIDDHEKKAENLEEAIDDSDLDVEAKDKLDPKHEALIEKLQGVHGAEFDAQYASIQKNAHNEVVQLFTDYSKTGDNKELKEFATETLPTLKDHKQHVQALK